MGKTYRNDFDSEFDEKKKRGDHRAKARELKRGEIVKKEKNKRV